tara:strand:- start:350 stop:640 length:291 start_codon:yes stop_codon:yes gene_type:complete
MNQKISREILPKIKAPKFKVASKFILNECELRALLVEVGKGKVKSGISVVDTETKEKVFILDNGALSGRLKGLSICSNFAMELMEIKIKKNPIKKI